MYNAFLSLAQRILSFKCTFRWEEKPKLDEKKKFVKFLEMKSSVCHWKLQRYSDFVIVWIFIYEVFSRCREIMVSFDFFSFFMKIHY